MRGEWEVVGFGHADGDDYHLTRVVLAAFETAEEALAAFSKSLRSLELAYEAAGGDVLFVEYAVQHNGTDITWS